MTKSPLFPLALLAGVTVQVTPLPTFEERLGPRPPLSLSDSIAQGALPSSAALRVAPQPAAARLAPPPARAPSASRMPVVEPAPGVEYKMLVKAPDPGIDYKMLIQEPKVASATPARR